MSTVVIMRQRIVFALTAAFCLLLTLTLHLEQLIVPDREGFELNYLQGWVQERAWKIPGGTPAAATETNEKTHAASPVVAGSSGSSPVLGNKGESTYQSPIPHDLSPQQARNLPLPVKIMEQYKAWHSQEALENDPRIAERKFAVGFYVCPLSAGNRMHEFFNYMLWAVVTNRTLLWKYYDQETCLQYAEKLHQDLIHCEVANAVGDCDQILERAPWIPSYDEWSDRLSIAPEDVVLLPRSMNNPKLVPPNKQNPSQTGVDSRFQKKKMVLFPHRTNVLENILGDKETMRKKLQTQLGRQTAKGLFSLGTNFLYGMLHRYSFDFAPQIRASVPALLTVSTPGSAATSIGRRRTAALDQAYTVALHSRHNDSRIDGCDVTNERRCLEKVLSKNPDPSNRQCRVAVMADRECTISTLREWLTKDKNCVVDVAEHEAGNGTYAEHGPFAGGGYFQDLALGATVARDAIVGSELHGGMWRSSSLLLMELVDFEKRMEVHWENPQNMKKNGKKNGGDNNNDVDSDLEKVSVEHCMLPKNNLVCHGWGVC